MYSPLLKTSKPLLKINSPHRLNSLEQTMVENIPPMNSMHIVLPMVSLIISHALTPLNKMALLRGNIDTELNVHSHSYLMLVFHLFIGPMPLPLPFISSTDYLHQSFLTNLLGKRFFTNPQIFLTLKPLGAYVFRYSNHIIPTSSNQDPFLVSFLVPLLIPKVISALTPKPIGYTFQDMCFSMKQSFCLIYPCNLTHTIHQSLQLLTPYLGC